jgi:hypothetical protein
MSLETFSAWLDATSLSQQIKAAAWVVPTIQTVHIAAICVVIGSSLMMDMRLLGVAKDVPISVYVRRYGPWIWLSIIVLLLSGITLIIGEPGRTLQNWVFWTKMSLVTAGALLTAVFAFPVTRDKVYWDSGARRGVATVIATLSLIIWIAVIACGRWIAYVL